MSWEGSLNFLCASLDQERTNVLTKKGKAEWNLEGERNRGRDSEEGRKGKMVHVNVQLQLINIQQHQVNSYRVNINFNVAKQMKQFTWL